MPRRSAAAPAARRALCRAKLREKSGPLISAGTRTNSSANVSKLGHLDQDTWRFKPRSAKWRLMSLKPSYQGQITACPGTRRGRTHGTTVVGKMIARSVACFTVGGHAPVANARSDATYSWTKHKHENQSLIDAKAVRLVDEADGCSTQSWGVSSAAEMAAGTPNARGARP